MHSWSMRDDLNSEGVQEVPSGQGTRQCHVIKEANWGIPDERPLTGQTLTHSALKLQGVMLAEDTPEAADKGASAHVPLHSHLPCKRWYPVIHLHNVFVQFFL